MAESGFDLQKLKSILLVELNHMGDVVHALPAARALKEASPQARLSMLVEESNRHVVEFEPSVDCVLTATGTTTLGGFLQAAREIRRERFDLICSLSPIRRNSLLALVARSRFTAGYLFAWHRNRERLRRVPVSARGFRLPFPSQGGIRHLSLTAVNVCSALGISVRQERYEIGGVTERGVLIPDKPYIVLHPFAGWAYRDWPEVRVREFVQGLLNTTELSLVMIGSEQEGDRIRAVLGRYGESGRVAVCAGLHARDLSALVLRAAAFVGVDSGPYQLCSLLGKRSLGLFGPTSPDFYGSPVPGSEFIFHRLDCSPCSQKRCVRRADPCMAMITSDKVLALIKKLIAQ